MSSSFNSRLSGGPVVHDGGDDVRPAATDVHSKSIDADDKPGAVRRWPETEPRTRPEPIPGSRAHARVGIAPTPDGVSEHSWQRLAVHASRALESGSMRGAAQLRPSVEVVAAEMRLTGAEWEVIERTVTSAITTHPDFGPNDRLNVVSGKRSSAALIARVIGWVHRARQLENPATPATRRGGSDRIDVEKAERVLEVLPPTLDKFLRDEQSDVAAHGDAMDRALTRSIMELRFTLNQQTFEYLRWRVDRLRSL